jgi:hypothetical protein
VATLIFVDHVLRSHTGTPVKQGIALYRTLKEKERVLLLCSHKSKDERWLRENKINLVDDLIGPDVPFLEESMEFRQVQHCRANWPIDLVITGDTELAARLLEAGMTTMLFLHPTYISEKFRPDSRQGVKPWAEMTEQLIKQQESYVEDHRVQEL